MFNYTRKLVILLLLKYRITKCLEKVNANRTILTIELAITYYLLLAKVLVN